MAKTYLPTLIKIIRRLAQYVAKYGGTLSENMTGPQQELLNELVEVSNALIEELNPI